MKRDTYGFNLAVSLRKKGKSYLEIHRKLGISKSTLSNWFAKKNWSNQIRIGLAKRNNADSRIRLLQLNKFNTEHKIQRYERYKEEARQEFKFFKKDPLFLIGVSIYWGEGEKTDNGRVSVINSDDEMIRTVISFYRNSLHVSNDKLRAALFLYQDLDERQMLQHWSEIINLPIHQFIKTQILPSRSTLTKRKTNYGMCTVYFSDTKLNIKMREWIKLLAQDMRV